MICKTFNTNHYTNECLFIDSSDSQVALGEQLLNRTDVGPCYIRYVALPGHCSAWWSH